MEDREKKPLPDDLWFDLEEEIGTILSIEELCPGVFRVSAVSDEYFAQEYLIVLDAAPVAAKVQAYGKKIDGLRLYAVEDNSSGWRVVQYEAGKYGIAVQGRPVPEWMFRDTSLCAMKFHPEYFGPFPVPFHTPSGYTLRHRVLANGIYWLETSMCKEFLAVCYPIWNAELSFAARMLCETPVRTIAAMRENAAEYIFFSKEVSCIPIYELMGTRGEWDGSVIHRPALMNAIWECLPKYALHVNGEKDPEFEAEISALMNDPNLTALPEPCGDRMIYMYPDTGTDFLLL